MKVESGILQRLMTLLLLCLWLPAAQAANDRSFFWQVKSDNSVVMLLGSIHFADDSVYPMRALIEKNFHTADALVVELDIAAIDVNAYSEYLARHGFYAEGDSLRHHVSNKTWQQLQRTLQHYDIPLSMVENKKPGLLVMDLTALLLAKSGYVADSGIDLHFIRQAKRLNKPVLALETLQQQLQLFINLPEADILLQQSLEFADEAEQEMQQLLGAWKSGDEKAMLQLMIEQPEAEYPQYRAINEALLYRRNDAMVRKIRQMLNSGKRYFVVVGAAHLIGERGIVQQLRTAGYQVQRR